MSNKIVIPSISKNIKGKAVLQVEGGKFVKVVVHDDVCHHNIGDIIMRTESDQQPFVNLKDGSLWGNSLENYEFQVLPFDTITLSHETQTKNVD